MQKCAMKYEGTMRKAKIRNQGIHDVALYAILARDYFGYCPKRIFDHIKQGKARFSLFCFLIAIIVK